MGSNTLRPIVPLLQKFSERSNFRKFYKENIAFYSGLTKCYQDSLKTGEMQKWLNLNFPSTQYNSFKIIFSPLVYGNQSANWFENNGFKEAQAHVNFPFTNGNWLIGLSPKARKIKRGDIVFTEINHAFINPEADKYKNEIISAFHDLDKWIEKDKPAGGYASSNSCFNEYINWGLVDLRYLDFAPKEEQDLLIKQVEERMTVDRGFKRFSDFNKYLVEIYKSKKDSQTISDLYPQIVEWFAKN